MDAARVRIIRGRPRPDKDPHDRVYVRVSDSSETELQLKGESAVLISDRDETIRLGEHEGLWRKRWFGEG